MRTWIAVVTLGIVLGISGTLGTIRDYAIIAIRQGTQWGSKAIPVSVEIERLELALSQLDHEIEKNERIVVEESVAMDRFQESISQKERSMAQTKNQLLRLRDKYVRASCETTKGCLEGEMSHHLARVKAQAGALDSLRVSAENRKKGYESMRAAFEDQKLNRDLLREKLQAYRAEYATMTMRGELERSTLASSSSRKAAELASQIEDRLEVQRRLSMERSKLHELDTSPSDSEKSFELSEVDALLGSGDRLATKE